MTTAGQRCDPVSKMLYKFVYVGKMLHRYKVFRHSKQTLVPCSKQSMPLVETDHGNCFKNQRHQVGLKGSMMKLINCILQYNNNIMI